MTRRRVFILALPLVAVALMTAVAYGAVKLEVPQATPTLPPIPQPHPRMEIVEANTEYVTVWAKPISCTYALVLGHVRLRGQAAMHHGALVTHAVPQGSDYTVYWEDIGMQPPAGQWANATWKCTMDYPTWEHGPVSFATLLVEQMAPP